MPALALGFRPFYLLAGLYSAVSVIVWSLQYAGWLPGAPLVYGPAWHAHEMLFGYTYAVIAGFLFTAVKNWTQRPTPTGAPLAALAALWLAGRLLSFTPWRHFSLATDVLFALGVAAGIAKPLISSANRRNYFFIALVLAFGCANIAFHASAAGRADFPPGRALLIAADMALLVIAIVSGRVVPMFTNNAVPGAGARKWPAVEYTALGSIVALVIADVAGAEQWAAAVAGIAAIAHAVRLAGWSPFATRRAPLLWILHISYAWLVVHLALRAASMMAGGAGATLAMHALTVGAIGGMTLGMMTRSALGHTGRPLHAGRAELASYVLVQLAAVARVFLPLLAPAAYLAATAASGVLWFTAFLVFSAAYWPILTRPRIDGRPG